MPEIIQKRNGEQVPFEPSKIRKAIQKAFTATQTEHNDTTLDYLTDKVVAKIKSRLNVSVEEVQDIVEQELMKASYYDVAKAYVKYRYIRQLARKQNTTDESILALLRNTNKELEGENSNKNTVINSTQRDYIAGEVSRDLTQRLLLPEKISTAHNEAVIHFHDEDYFIQNMINCFAPWTKFRTKDGLKAFEDCKDGETVEVLGEDGQWHEATVRNYGNQPMFNVTLEDVDSSVPQSVIGVTCTRNHRWVLQDGTVTTDLKYGDVLKPAAADGAKTWRVRAITPYGAIGETQPAWCVEEPVTHTFTLAGNILTGNCCLINIGDILENGTVMNGKLIESPHSFRVACTITTQVIACVASNQYGGQSVDLRHLGRFLRMSREKIRKRIRSVAPDIGEEAIEKIADADLHVELAAGVQTIQYQINTLMTTNGQSPFVTLFLNLRADDPYIEENAMIIQEVLEQRLLGIKNEAGVYITPAFPKLVYVLDEHNCLKGGKYDYLTKLAVKCSAARMYPDYISAKKMRENYQGNVFSPMGCRSFLAPWKTPEGEYKFEGRFNQGVVSLNLPQIGILAAGDEDKFWALMEERLQICFEALMCRHNALKHVLSDSSPIHWQYGAIARLKKGESIEPMLYGGYSSISLGYIGLYECTIAMKGVSHTTEEGQEFAMRVMKRLRKACDDWKAETNIGFALYGTPAESLCYRFARIDRERFGDIPNVTDKGYYTNSYHVDVREKIDAFSKFTFENQFQPISSGGCISYAEIPNMRHNLAALEALVQFIYDNIQYAEFNTKADVCNVCGFHGEIKVNDHGTWECPCCHNTDKRLMNIVRRTCGYLGENYWNVGKTEEISKRVEHL